MFLIILLGVFALLAIISYFILDFKTWILGMNSVVLLYLIRVIVRLPLLNVGTYKTSYLHQEGGMMALIWGCIYYLAFMTANNYSSSSLQEYELWESIQTKAIVGVILYIILFGFGYTVLSDSPIDAKDIGISSIGFLIWYTMSFGLTDFITKNKT